MCGRCCATVFQSASASLCAACRGNTYLQILGLVEDGAVDKRHEEGDEGEEEENNKKDVHACAKNQMVLGLRWLEISPFGGVKQICRNGDADG